jgi:hypothetical protein
VPTTIWGKVNQGKIELLELVDLPEGARVLVTLVPSSEQPPLPKQNAGGSTHLEPDLWLQAEPEDLIWDNIEDETSEPLLALPSPVSPQHRSE